MIHDKLDTEPGSIERMYIKLRYEGSLTREESFGLIAEVRRLRAALQLGMNSLSTHDRESHDFIAALAGKDGSNDT